MMVTGTVSCVDVRYCNSGMNKIMKEEIKLVKNKRNMEDITLNELKNLLKERNY